MKLEWKSVVPCALALALFGSLATAQDQDPPPSGGSTTPRSGKPVPRSRVPVSIPVEHVTAEAANTILGRLRSLEHEVYICKTCKAQSRVEGPCARCSSEEVEKGAPTKIIAKAELSVDRSFLTVTLEPHHWGSLAELDAILGEYEARTMRSEFRLPTHARFSVTGVDGEKAAKRLRTGLIDLKVFPGASVVAVKDTTSVWVYPKYESPGVAIERLEEVLGKMRGELALEDVQWGAFCPACGTKPASEIGSPVHHID